MLALKNITKIYAEKTDNAVHALKGIDLAFRKKEFVSILGQSGCGKTTMLNIIGGLDRYTSGDLIINGISTKEYKDKDWDTYRNHSIGFVFQSYNLIPHQTILENVELSMTLGGVEYNDRKKRAKDVLIKLGLGDKLNKKPTQLSGGQCQRVAIARAIVNEPDIILADEPTGALDSETSVTIMDILKEISKEKLVIMVTHNPELAEKYSDRIIRMFDGNLIGDSKPYSFEDEENEVVETKNEVVDQIVYKKKHSSMSFFTALRLSGMNLLSKFRRTLITSLAASIGIIGIAVILSVSNGMQEYIDTTMSDIASANYISVQSSGVNLDSLNEDTFKMNKVDLEEFSSENKLYPYKKENIMDTLMYTQEISNDFVNYLEEISKDKVIDISYSYGINVLSMVKYFEDGENHYALSTNSSYWSESLSNIDYLDKYYDSLVYSEGRTTALPTGVYDVALVVDKYNRLDIDTLKGLGIISTEDVTSVTNYQAIDFNDLLGKEFKIILNDDYYTYNESRDVYEKTPTNSLSTLYENENNITVKIEGIVRIKEDSESTMLSTGLIYHPDLIKRIMEINSESDVVKAQAESTDKNVVTGSLFSKTNKESQYNSQLRKLGGKSNPSSITIYPTSVDTKNEIVKALDEWNNTEGNTEIKYTDVSKLVTSVLGEMVDITTYVLMAFSITSLVISSIMIAIIIYASVIERTKEIGVLRSIGARKKDVSRVFQAEAVILGAVSGVIAIIITTLLDIVINIILVKLVNVDNIAKLAPLTAMGLICLSVFLLLIASLIPASMAAKKEPAIALRTE